MTRKSLLPALAGLLAMLFAGTALAGHPSQGIPHPGKAYGHVKHYGYSHHGSYSRYRGHHAGYSNYSGYYRAPPRVVYYSRHVHGPYCGHHGYTYYGRDYGYRPYYRRDYGRAAFSGFDDDFGYYVEFRY